MSPCRIIISNAWPRRCGMSAVVSGLGEKEQEEEEEKEEKEEKLLVENMCS